MFGGFKMNTKHAGILLVGIATCALSARVGADPLGAGDGTVYRMSERATFQEGCFPPCLCPIFNEQPATGTMKLVYHGGPTTSLHTYSVEDVSWRVIDSDGSLRPIVGRGKYTIGSPNNLTVMQQRMELDLVVGDDPPEHFDSGWVAVGDMSRIHVLVSIHGMFCWDRVVVIDADRVPREGVTPYALQPGSTYEHGCCRTSPCDCACFGPVPMDGGFGLLPLSDNSLFREFAVLNVAWHVISPSVNQTIPIRGHGFYWVGGEFAARHRLSLELWVSNAGPSHFDSGWVVGGGPFPAIDILVSQRGMDPAACVDTILHVVAKPVEGDVLCGGIAGFPCPDGFYCKLPDGHCCCDFMGVCAPIPEACPEYYDPVCGCDGVTYSNECFAAHAGVSIDHRGECGRTCGGIIGIPCPKGYFCKLNDGDCCCDFTGRCAPIPTGCPDVWDPVCGCDGNTYSNECDANTAGVSIDHRGPCRPGCVGPDGALGCPPGEFCKLPIGVCDPTGQSGVCQPIPQACTRQWDPVCGCDGNTYGNECDADRAGVAIAHRGECRRGCNDPAGDVCGPDEFCKQPTGVCDATAPGVCTIIPQACPAVWMPVCGCNSVTYGNECEADYAGLSLKHTGPCDRPCASSRDLGDPERTYCPGSPKRIRIALTPPKGAVVLGVEDGPPIGWIVTDNISHDGVYDAVNHKVKWGPLFPPFPTALSYEVIPQDVTNFGACFSGTVSVNGANQGICGDACVTISCCPRLEADSPQPDCPGCAFGDCENCAGGACEDGRISLCEVIGYACAWLHGCNDDLSGMTRAAFIWRSGECYCSHWASQSWLPTTCPAPPSGCCSSDSSGGEAAVIVEVGSESAAAETLLRHRRTVVVQVAVDPPPGTSAVALEVHVPRSWTPTAISEEGQWDSVHRKVKWGPFFDDRPFMVTFELPRAARGKHRDLRGLTGTVSFDGNNQAIDFK